MGWAFAGDSRVPKGVSAVDPETLRERSCVRKEGSEVYGVYRERVSC